MFPVLCQAYLNGNFNCLCLYFRIVLCPTGLMDLATELKPCLPAEIVQPVTFGIANTNASNRHNQPKNAL